MNEKRVFESTVSLEARAAGETPKLAGYAAVYNKRSFPIDGYFVEVFKPGAFRDHLMKSPDVRAFAHHDPQRVLGRTLAGTLRLQEDAHGLRFELDLPDTTDGRDIAELVRRRDITGMSFAFRTLSDQWRREDGQRMRDVIKAELIEISPVTFPAYGDTTVALRKLDELRAQESAELAEMEMRIRLQGHTL